MKSSLVKSLLLTGVLNFAAGTAGIAQVAYSGYWVVGNAVAQKCDIVTSNPIIDYRVGSFGTGPYQSLDDAKLARSTIGACPKDDPSSAVNRNPDDDASDSPG